MFLLHGIVAGAKAIAAAFGWDLSTAAYTDNAGGNLGANKGLFIKDDGLEAWFVENGADVVYHFNMDPAWDITTLAYDGVNKSVNAQNANLQGLSFNSTGTKMYTLDNTSDDIFQYSLSTAWDITSASYDSVSLDCSSQTTSPIGLKIVNGGTKLYITSTTVIYQYTMSTAWDLSTASYDSKSLTVSGQLANNRDMLFNDDGTKVYAIGRDDLKLVEYTLSTAWDVSSAVSAVVFVVNTASNLRGMYFNSDGTAIIICAQTGNKVIQIILDTPYDLTTANNAGNKFTASAQATEYRDIAFKTDGTKFYLSDNTGFDIYQYSCSTAWNINSASYDTKTKDFSAECTTGIASTWWKPDGTKLYVTDYADIYQYSLSTAWDITTATYDSKTYAVPLGYNPGGMYFKSDGTKVFYSAPNDDKIYMLDLSTAWDISTATQHGTTFDISTYEIDAGCFFMNPGGTRMYVGGVDSDTLYQFDMSTAYDLSTASYNSVSYSIVGTSTWTQGMYISSDGTQIYTVAAAATEGDVYQHSM